MNKIISIDRVIEIIREQLIFQSQLSPEQVLNSLSIHGEDLDKLFEEQQYVSIDKSDALILFEFRSRQSESDITTTEQDQLLSYRSFSVYCVIYGNDSTQIANLIYSRFLTEEVIQLLSDNGIYLETVAEPIILNEYKNNTMWVRNDVDIQITCKIISEKISNAEYFSSIDISKIINI